MTDYLQHPINYNTTAFANIFDEMSLWGARFGMFMLDHLELRGGITALDLGCGTGFPLFELAHVHGPSSRFYGVDIWKAGLERAAQKLAYYNWLKNVVLIEGDGARLPFPDSSFDLIVSNLTINNFDNPGTVLVECARVMQKNGRIVFATNPKGHMREFYEIYRDVLGNNAAALEKLAANENHRLGRDEISTLLESAGFRVNRVVEDEFTLRFLDGSAFLRHSLTRVGFLDGWRVTDPAEEEVVFAALEDRLNALAREHGELRLTVPMLYVEGTKHR